MTEETGMKQQHVLVIRSTTHRGVIESSKDLCKVWPAHTEDTSLWSTTVVLENATKILDDGAPKLGSLDDLVIVMDGVARTDLSDELFGLILDRATYDVDQIEGENKSAARELTHNVYVRSPDDVMFTPFTPLAPSPTSEENKAATNVLVVTDRIATQAAMTSHMGTLLLQVHPSSRGYTIRGRTLSAIIIETKERLHPMLVNHINLVERCGVPVIRK